MIFDEPPFPITLDAFITFDTLLFVGTALESLLYGLYCIAFAVHTHIRSKKKDGGINIAIYPLSILFMLCTIYCAIDTAQTVFTLLYQQGINASGITSYYLNIANTAVYCAITFISQSILIYRCWLMWGRQMFVVGVPTVLALLSFATSLAMIGSLADPSASLSPDKLTYPWGATRVPGAVTSWFFSVNTAAFSASLGVNAIVTILLAIKIYQVQRIAEQSLAVQKHPIRSFVSIANGSGMLMLGCQIIWLTFFCLNNVGFLLIRGPIVMIYGLTPTLINQRITLPVAQTSSKEKQRNDPSTSVRFTI